MMAADCLSELIGIGMFDWQFVVAHPTHVLHTCSRKLLPASMAPWWPCWIDDGLLPIASPPSKILDVNWWVIHWFSLLSPSWLPVWWFTASRWEYNDWHHPIGPFLWKEREGRAYLWWLLQVLKILSGEHKMFAYAMNNINQTSKYQHASYEKSLSRISFSSFSFFSVLQVYG